MEESQGQEKERKHLLQNLCENKARLFEIWHARENCSNGQSSVNKSVSNTFSLQYAEAMGLSHPILPPPALLGKSYLDLRHDQNMAWAQDRLDKGVSLARASLQPSTENKHALARKAEACYKEGLEMIPNHVGILTAYGALCANDGRLSLAKKMLEKAISQCEIKSSVSSTKDANVPDKASKDATTYLSIVERKIEDLKRTDKKGSNARVTLSNKGEKLLNDALAERAFLTGNDPKDCSIISSKYKLLSSSSSESSISSDESRRLRKRSKSRHKKRKKKTRSKSRHRDESRSSHRRKQRKNGDDDSDEHSSTSYDYKSRKRQSRGERKRKRKRR
eukprot:251771_1